MKHAVPLVLLLTSCTVQEKPFSLPAEAVAMQLGPHANTGREPRIFVADAVDEATLSELAPYCGKSFVITEHADVARCVRTATRALIKSRPDAILVVPARPEVTGVTTSFFANPFAPGIVSMSTANYQTAYVAYAMRAMRARLPFTYNAVTGIVTDIPDRTAAPALLEGDVLTQIDGAVALPPKAWPEWPYYARMLDRKPGDQVTLEWVRAGTGKMSGTARLAAAQSPHRKAKDSVSTELVSWIREYQENGQPIWRVVDPDPY